MKILLLGANGQVGTALRRSLAPLGEIVPTTRSGMLDDGAACEVADFDSPVGLADVIERIAPDVVVNSAAYTAVDRAEDDAATAYRVNAEAPRAIAAACAARDALLVHYSTDYVFDGTGKRPYREDDPTAPLGVYGATKLAGETAVRDSGARHFIFRSAWVYAAHGRNFLLTMLRLAKERDELRVVADQIGTPTSAELIAYATAAAIHSPRESGLWHLTASGQASWHEFAEAVVREAHGLGLIARLPRVIPIATSEFPTRAARPAYSVLDNSAFQRDFGIELANWYEGMVQVLDELAL